LKQNIKKFYLPLNQLHIKSKIIGIILVIVGSVLFIRPALLNIKIGLTFILIGTFTLLMISERNILKEIYDFILFIISEKNINNNKGKFQIGKSYETVKLSVIKKIRDLGLTGYAVFLPKSKTFPKEINFIPLNKIENSDFFSTTSIREIRGISVQPLGLKLLEEMGKKGDLQNTSIENIEEKLQTFVGMNLLKSVSIKKEQKGWKLELEYPILFTNDHNLCKQYPCPTCSAVLVAITRAFKSKILIYDISYKGKKITFHLKIG